MLLLHRDTDFHKTQTSQPRPRFLRDAIYNIIISDFINEIYKEDLGSDVEISRNLLLAIQDRDQMFGTKYDLFGFLPNENESEDILIFRPEEHILSQVIDQMLHPNSKYV